VATTTKPRLSALRKDAQIRQDRLLQAAVELYASDGMDVPLEKVAERAGVSRPTLYRNFPDREALSLAVLKAHMNDLTDQIVQWQDRDDAFFLAMRVLAAKTINSGGFQKMSSVHRRAPLYGLEFRAFTERLLAEPLDRAKAAGLVRQDFQLADVNRAILMVAGGGFDNYGDEVADSIERALELFLRGLAP
jgi:AcrR family transcriptional regulator